MARSVVVALGGNALGSTLAQQMVNVRFAARAVADMVIHGVTPIVVHGNGPQVGMIYDAMERSSQQDDHIPKIPMSVCVAMSQGYIGYDIQNALREELANSGINKEVCTLITQTVVDAQDTAFENPTKPVGYVYDEQHADKLRRTGYDMRKQGDGYRRVVPSPEPADIVEGTAVKMLSQQGIIVIAGGGGGIPVVKDGNHMRGVGAVVDKDKVAAKLADMCDADTLLILTAVESVIINYKQPDSYPIASMTAHQAEEFARQGQFESGSMLPKVEAAINFVSGGDGRRAIITSLEHAADALRGNCGTVITTV